MICLWEKTRYSLRPITLYSTRISSKCSTISKNLIVTKNKDGLSIFLDAPVGTGKTFTLNILVTWMITENLKVTTSTASGIAATLLFLGQTTHHRFMLPITSHKDSVCNIKKESDTGKFLSYISLGIIDEGPVGNGFNYVYPWKSKEQHPETLMSFIHDVGIPQMIVSDGGRSFTKVGSTNVPFLMCTVRNTTKNIAAQVPYS